jgi:hypothetical protein
MMLHPVEPLAVTPTPWLRTFACRRCKGASQVNIRKVRRIDERWRISGVKFVEKIGFPNIFDPEKKPIKGFLVIWFFLNKKNTKIP